MLRAPAPAARRSAEERRAAANTADWSESRRQAVRAPPARQWSASPRAAASLNAARNVLGSVSAASADSPRAIPTPRVGPLATGSRRYFLGGALALAPALAGAAACEAGPICGVTDLPFALCSAM